MAEDKPAFTKGYGEAKEDKMSAQAERERQEVGLSPEEVREINRPEQSKSRSKSKMPEKAISVVATVATAAGGVGLASLAEDALKNIPLPRVAEAKPDLKRDNPPSTPGLKVQFPQDIRSAPQPDAPVVEAPPPDAPVEPVYTNRVFAPFISREAPRPETKEENTPLWPDKIGEFAPYNFEVVNMGRRAGVEIMDQELFSNLLEKMKQWGIAPEVPRRVFIYEDNRQLARESIIPLPDPSKATWSPGNSLLGAYSWRVAKLPDGSLQFDISLPFIKDSSRMKSYSLSAGIAMTQEILSFLFTDKDGNYQDRDRFNLNYARDGGLPIYKWDNNRVISAPLYAKYISP